MAYELSEINFRELTKYNFRDIIRLNVKPAQKEFVAPNSYSIAEAYFNEYAWFRGIYNNDTPIGFIMLADPISEEVGEFAKYNGKYFLWRFMIDRKHQKKGYGKKALDLLCKYVRNRPNADYLYASYEEGENGPERFYLKYGFEKTGEILEDEMVIRLKL